MAKYYFDVRTGRLSLRDGKGANFASLAAAESEAIRSLADIARSALLAKKITNTAILVRNDTGETVTTVSLKFVTARSKPWRARNSRPFGVV